MCSSDLYSYLVGHRLAPYERAITFNSNGTDADRISTGSKDDMDYATVQEVAPIARRLGIETFILSGYPHLEEAYRFAELVFPHLPRRHVPQSTSRLSVPAVGEIIGNTYVPGNSRS